MKLSFDYMKMRRADREITDFDEILDVLRRADTIRLGMNGDPYPYVVPLSYGFEALDDCGAEEYKEVKSGRVAMGGRVAAGVAGAATGGRVAVYVHGASVGLKHDLLARDKRVCVEAGIFHRYVKYGEGAGSGITTEYESVVGFGEAEVVTGEEARRGMDLILEHCGYPGFEYATPAPGVMTILKFTLNHISGKRRFV